MQNIANASVYVGTYGKYNAGSIEGQWLNLADYASSKEFYDTCRELHKDEPDDECELMFQDWEDCPDSLISECSISERLFGLVKAALEMSETERKAFTVWLDELCYDNKKDADAIVEQFRDAYIGEYNSEEDFAEALVEEDALGSLSEVALRYFDYAAFARDLFMTDYYYTEGFVFCRH